MTNQPGLPFRAVAFDLDDTLLRDDLTISDYTISVLRRLSARGVKIIPASGRAKLSMKSFVDQIGCASVYISCNGAELWDAETHNLIHAELFSAETGKQIAAYGKSRGCYTQTYDGEYFFYNEESVWAERYAASSKLKGIYVGDLEDYIREPRNKILMMAEEDKIADMLREAEPMFHGVASVTCSKPWFLEFNPPEATKGKALRRAVCGLGLETDDILAFGDSLNDLSMLQTAGRGVLMANGRTDLRPLCDDVCPSNQEDGVARYLEALFF